MNHEQKNIVLSPFEKAMMRGRSNSNKLISNGHRTSDSESRYLIKNIALTEIKRIPLNKEELRQKKIFVDARDKDTAIAISAYRHLRTNVLKTLDSFNGRTLLVTGPTAAVGKTTTAINLAINVARHSQRTALLIDLDLRKPGIHKVFNYEPESGVIDIIQGRARLEDTLVSPHIERFTLLPGKDVYENSSELLSTDAMKTLLRDVKHRYPERLVIIDTPPALAYDDVEVLAAGIDVAY